MRKKRWLILRRRIANFPRRLRSPFPRRAVSLSIPVLMSDGQGRIATLAEFPRGAAVLQTSHDITSTELLEAPDSNTETEQGLWTQPPNSRSFFSKASSDKRVNRPSLDIGAPFLDKETSKDIGDTKLTAPKSLPTELQSHEQEVLRKIREIVGDQPVSESKLQFAPRWILDKAIAKEKANYKEKEAYRPVSIRSLRRGSNIISSHHFFHVKTDGEEGKLKLKCRLVPHGNRDAEKDSICKDSATAQFDCIRLLLSLATIFHLTLASLDVSAAYLQAGRLGRDIYMRPPKGWSSFIDEVWKLVKPAYGLVESGRLWQICIERWFQEYGFDTIPGMPQLFVLRCRNSSRILLLIAKVVDDLLLAGAPEALSKFKNAISVRFKIGRYMSGSRFIFNRLHITRYSNGDVHLSMREFMDTIEGLPISRARRKQQDEKATLDELRALQALAGKLKYLGHGILPQASLVASKLQLKRLDPSLIYKAPSQPGLPGLTHLLTFSDASTGTSSYGQTGFLTGIFLPTGGSSCYHCVAWHSSKQACISFSSIGAEILAAAESCDRSILLSHCISRTLSLESPLPLAVTVDSLGLYSTITTLHKGRDYRLRPTVARLRDSFESRNYRFLMDTWYSQCCRCTD